MNLPGGSETYSSLGSRLYRLYTEDKGNVAQLVAPYFDSCTVLTATGYWRGIAEPSVVVEILGTAQDSEKVARLAEHIRVTNAQESVLVTMQPVSVVDVRAPQ